MFLVYQYYVNLYIEQTGDTYYLNRIQSNKTNPKIYDISHKYLPDLHDYDAYSNFHHLITFGFLIPILFNASMLYEFFGYWFTIFIIRSITIMVTILPKHKHCNNDNSFIFVGQCYDKIFSGHFSSVLLATILYKKYGWINTTTMILLNFINSLSILLSRGHYTIDLIVAYFVTLYVYQNKLTIF